MVIALLFVSLLSGLAGVALAVFAELGLMMGIAAYMVGGMAGTAGFVVFTAIRCTPDTAGQQAPNAPQISG